MRMPRTCLVALLAALSGCGGPATPSAGISVAPPPPLRPLGIVEGRQLTVQDAWGQLVEAAGAEIWKELVLGAAVDAALEEKGISLTEADVAFERRLLVNQLDPSAGEEALADLLAARNLGPRRTASLLARSAGLRTLVRDDVVVTQEGVDRMYDLVHGPRIAARVLVTTTLEEARSAHARLQRGETFATVATEISIDASAQLGGLVEPVSPADSAWPASIRDALRSLSDGAYSAPIFLSDRWVVAMRSHIIESPGPSRREVDEEMRRLARLAHERIEMERLARLMLDRADRTILDADLHRALQDR